MDNDDMVTNLIDKVNRLNQEKEDLERALRVAKEQSMLSADKGEVMVVKMENHKIKEGRRLMEDNTNMQQKIRDLQKEITSKNLRIQRLENKFNM